MTPFTGRRSPILTIKRRAPSLPIRRGYLFTMSIIILIPALICIYMLFRESVQRVFLDVYLPVFMLLPVYYFWKVPALPPIDFAEATLLPLGIAIVLLELPRWRFTTMDLWMVLFLVSACYADKVAGKQTIFIFDVFSNLTTALVPYMAGKLLIEQHGARIATVRRFVFLLFVTCILSAYEYRMGQNPFSLIWSRFFPGESFAWKTQIRWGFGRLSGPFAQSELAGIILFTGVVLALWLAYCHLWERRFHHFKRFPLSKSITIVALLALSLLMTQARGPWLGCLVAVPIAFIGRSRHVLRRAIITLAVIGIAGSLAYSGLQRYTAGPTASDEQQTAQYRAQLVSNYMPVVLEGGAWGWGWDFPHVGGQGSIDNEYLYLAITQGFVGVIAFCLLAIEAVVRLILAAAFGPTQPDRYFAYSMLGIELGIILTIFTVFLGLQAFELFFLLAGWSQSVWVRPREHAQLTFESVYS